MDVDRVRKNILHSEDFVLEEIRKLQVLFELKRVIRYHHTREEIVDTESVAEHVYGMHVLANYFMPLEDKNNTWDNERIYLMALFHDIDEIETGDTIGYLKTTGAREREHVTQKRVVEKLPESMQNKVRNALAEYEQQETIEAQFVKAMDKIEPVFHLLNENGRKILLSLKTTLGQYRSIKDSYVAMFPCVKQFNEVATKVMQKEGFYS